MDLHRLWRFLALLIFILATYFSTTLARQHRHKHGKQRDKRYNNAPGIYVSDDNLRGPERGPWGQWSIESPCSRTCGGGVTYQTRNCSSGYCTGPSKRYMSCNIQDCPEGSRDFRAEQCAAFDVESFDSVYYNWVPYTKAPNKCELNCMPYGERFYYRHREKVADGTRCEEEKLDVCVEGKCLPVGCDMMLGSPAREDKCRECGGDNSSCNTATGILHNEPLQVGYNDILLIPAGATNIRVHEVQASNNYLAIRNVSGHYYLNGNWRIDFPRSLRFAGTVFHYERKPHAFFAPETIHCLGPTTEALYIVLLYQETNPGVEYEYSLPKGHVQVTDPDAYVWHTSDFSPCSTTCGGGTQQRNVSCVRRKDLLEVSRDLCDSSNEPAQEGSCAAEPCLPRWSLGEWGPCSQPCGPGATKIRQVICEQVVSNGRPSLVDNKDCEEIHGAPPPSSEECPDLPCPMWHIGPWLPCDKLCGDGKQRRKVRCFRKVEGRIEVLGDSACSIEKPETEMDCNLRPCEGLDWIVSDWSGCEEKCGSNFETRDAVCATKKGEIYPESFCHKYRLPKLTQECPAPAECQYEWFASQWSECSVHCGSGIQTRKVFCGTYEGENLKKVENSNCDLSKKYEDTQNCTGKEECKGQWYSGPWSACSKPCGGGVMVRETLCLMDNVTVKKSNCDGQTIPFSNEPCNNNPCGKDEIVPVESTKPVTDEEEEDCEYPEYDDILEHGGSYDANIPIRIVDNYDGNEEVDNITPFNILLTESTSIEFTSSGSTEKSTDLSSIGIITSESESSSESSSSESTMISETMMSDSSYSSESSMSSSLLSSVGSTDSYETETEPSSTSSDISTTSELSSSSSVSDAITDLLSSTMSSLGLTGFSTSVSSLSSDVSETSTSGIDSTTTSSSSSDESTTSSTDSTSESSSEISSSSSPTPTYSESPSTTGISELTTSETSSGSSSGSTGFTESSTVSLSTQSSDYTTGEISSSTSSSSSFSTGTSTGTSESESSTSSGTATEISSTTESGSSTGSSIDFSSSSSSSSSSLSTDGVTSEDYSSTEISTETSETLETSESSSVSEQSSSSSGTESSFSPYGSSTDGSSYTTEYEETSSVSPGSTDIDTGSTPFREFWSTQSPAEVAFTKEQRPQKCKRKKKKPKTPNCAVLEFGCCPDNVTEAMGPFHKGCVVPTTCKETEFGCCPDEVSPSLGPSEEGCPPSQCNATLFGCCPDGYSIAEGNDYEGCPEEVTLPFDCKLGEFGCCPDGIRVATGPKFAGCFECEGSGECDDCSEGKYGCCPDGITPAEGPDNLGCEQETTEGFIIVSMTTDIEDCNNSTYGCCPDGVTVATGENNKGCPVEPTEETDCSKSEFGCCPDGNTTATGPNEAGCPSTCPDEPWGCCDDNKTPAHGPNKEGCCLGTRFGCCPDNIKPAEGPSLEGCGCQYSTYSCCPDQSTPARGPNNEGCGCQYTEHGCCPNKYTPAAGPNFQGCPCHTHQFGCCPDGVTRAKGPHLQGCGCENTEFGCCLDGHTPALGPERNCSCEASLYGCCLDGVSEALGEHFEGCSEVPVSQGEQCALPKDRGTCRDFTVKWFFDTEYGGCSRFWYGGCEGNGNRFKTKDECREKCVEPKGRDACYLPKIEGPCEGYYPTWYYDSERKQCGQFIYGGCLGNNNKFKTREECNELCVLPDTLDDCDQPVEKGSCRGDFIRWHYNKEQKTCSEFSYGGCKANGNNFLTELACQQKCLQPGRSRDECVLPRAQGSCSERLPRWFFDVSENRCMPFYYSGCDGNANSFLTQEECESSCPPKIEQDTCSLPVVAGECHNYTESWYYDLYERRCRQFYYGGCGGNENRFKTEIDCQRRCDNTYVTTVEPPSIIFTTDMCFLPLDKGPCSSSDSLMWYYDSHSGVCVQFIYGGCEGNMNRFETRQDCEHKCGEAQDICNLPKLVGPCSGNYQQWYYDVNTDLCNQFDYGGCQGNRNRFNTRNDCEQKCKKSFPPEQVLTTVAPPGLGLPKSDICYTAVDIGPCNKQIPAWYFNYETGNCQLFIYGGCDGNANRFDSEEQCKRHCGEFQGQDVCKLPVDVGPCTQNLRKWYFDSLTQSCQEFSYGGCYGSANRFSSEDECNSICIQKEEIFPTANTTAISHIAVCRLPVDAGPCSDGYYRRWYFSEAQRTCQQFIYGGCAGNLNRFKSFQTCIDFCASLAITNEIVGPDVKQECVDVEMGCSQSLHCAYGVERWVDSNGCENCRCHNPCVTSDPRCPANTACSVQLQKNEQTGDIEYHAVCQPISKEGQCPPISKSHADCSEECKTDADCPGDIKCCYNGCGTSCMRPYQELVTEAPSPSYPYPGASSPRIDETVDNNVEGEEGNMTTLRCIVTGIPIPTIIWYKETIQLGDTGGRYLFLTDGSLQIIGLIRSDGGVYTCIADNGVGEPARREYILTVRDPVDRPAVVIGDPNASVIVTLGSQAVLQCFTIGYPRPAVTWWRGSRMLPLNSEQYEQRRDHSLLLHSVTLTALGFYTCQAYNGIGRATSWTVTLKAIGPVYSTDPNDVTYNQFLVPPPRTPPAETGNHPRPPPYKPYHPPPPVHATHYPPAVVEPTLPPPTPEQPRVFVVPVKTNISMDQTTFAVGSDISIPCDVDGYPVPQVRWYKDNQLVEAHERVHITESSRLMIREANTSDAGTYRCEASNAYSSADSSVSIHVDGVFIHPNCTDNPFFANCALIVKAQFCTHTYYARFCCKSCTQAGQLPSIGPHLGTSLSTNHLDANSVFRRRKRSLVMPRH